uniref:Ovule protein n=1 Tax=Meloidogyne incognita TaxID=6306 RepID=A0A914KJ20_MELIC
MLKKTSTVRGEHLIVSSDVSSHPSPLITRLSIHSINSIQSFISNKSRLSRPIQVFQLLL